MMQRACALALVITAAGCLRAPEGLPALDGGGDDAADAEPDADLTWPPAGLIIAAAAGGDFDGDAVDDLALIAVNDSVAGGGVYLRLGGSDTFTLVRPLDDIEPPVGAGAFPVIDGDGVELVILHDSDANMHVTTLGGAALDVVGSVDLGVSGATGTIRPWIAFTPFPNASPHLTFGMGNELRHLRFDELDAQPATVSAIPPPVGGWVDPQVAASAGSGQSYNLVVGGTTKTHVTTIPVPGDPFSWTEVRSSEPWVGQVAVDLDADLTPDVVGYDPINTELCALDPTNPLLNCIDHTALAGGTVEGRVASVVGGAAPDLIQVSTGATGGALIVRPDLTLIASALGAGPAIGPADFDLPNASLAIVGTELHVIGDDGTAACFVVGPTTLEPC